MDGRYQMRTGLCVSLVFSITAIFPVYVCAQEEPSGFTGDWSSQTACEDLMSLFSRQSGADVPSFRVADNDKVSVALSSGACWVAIHRGPWGVPDHHAFEKAFGGVRKLESLALGEFVVCVIVNAKNPVRALSVEDIAGIYRGQILDWDKVRGIKGKPINIFSPPFTDTACHILQLNALQGYEFDKRLRDWSAKPLRMKSTSDGVIGAVAEDENAIGFFLADHREKLDKRVKVVSIVPRGKKEAVAPSMENLLAGRYPLTQTLTMYLHPNASLEARRFCEFAVAPANRDVLRKHKLFPQCDFVAVFAEKRLADAKSGRGDRLSTIGIDSARSPFQDLATEYVRAKAVVQLAYSAVDADVSSIGAFVNGEGASVRELLVLGDKPSSRAMELHGEKWNSLGVDKDGKPDGTGPKEHMIAGRAAAIIVNPANKLESLTLGQIQAIFQGEVDDWAVIGGTELTPPAGPGGRPGTLDIHAFGLYSREPATAIFEKEGVPRDKWKHVTLKKDTAEALAAVSMDLQAIAFVDLAAIPAAGQSVKVLPVKFGQGEKARNIAPTAENIKNAMYPLSQRYFLYVHPKASDTAKDFASFLATCGGSEASPYADTVKAVMDTYRKHGLIPLADEAITRVAKDAMAEAAVKARAEEAAKARSKRR